MKLSSMMDNDRVIAMVKSGKLFLTGGDVVTSESRRGDLDIEFQLEESSSDDGIGGFCSAVSYVLRWWLDTHYNPYAWASEMTADCGVNEFHDRNEVIVFCGSTLDWSRRIYEAEAQRQIDDEEIQQCDECGYVVSSDWTAEHDEEQHDGQEQDYSIPEIEDVIDRIEQLNTDLRGIDPDTLLKSLILLHEDYLDAISDAVHGVYDEVIDMLRRIETAHETNNWNDMIVLMNEATRVWHSDGSIVHDYGEYIPDLITSEVSNPFMEMDVEFIADMMDKASAHGLTAEVIDQWRNCGLSEIYEEDELMDFIQNGCESMPEAAIREITV